jgi:hypothetical protein
MLLVVAFFLVILVAGVPGAPGAPKNIELASGGGMFLFAASIFWRSVREDRNRVECSKLHPSVAERSKKV